MNDGPAPLDLRWALPVGVGWLGLVLALPHPPLVGPTAAALAALSLASLVVALIGRRSPGRSTRGRSAVSGLAPVVALVTGLTGLLLGGAALRHDVRYPPDLVASVAHTVEIEAVAGERITADSSAAAVEARTVRSGQRVWQGAASMLVLGPRVDQPVGVGQAVTFRATVLPVEPGGDAAFVVAARGVLRAGAPAAGLAGRTEAMRASFRDVAEGLPGDGGALLPGLTIGDTSAVPDDLRDAMRTSSLSHLTAVSGSNCAVLVALTMMIGGVLRLRRVVRVVAASGVLAAFLVLVTPDASIVRATIMALLVLGHLAGSRPVSGLPVVAVAVTVMLIADPWISRDVGFALSVLATAGLVVLAAPVVRLLARVLPEPLALILAVPIAAQLACGPVLLLLDPGLPVHGVVANVLAEPAAPLATVLGLVVCATAGWAPGPAAFVAGIAWGPASWVAAVARSVSTWPAARLEWGRSAAAIGLLVLLTALIVVLVLAARGGRVRRAAAVSLVAVVVLSAGAVAGSRLGARVGVPRDWTIAQCDVGQGDAVLVRSGDGVALIDVGDDVDALRDCLELFGVGEVHLLVLTHFDSDHVGAVSVVEGRTEVVLVGPPGRDRDRAVIDGLQTAGASVVDARAGTSGGLGELSWEVLWPPGEGSAPAAGNDASLVLRFSPGASCREGCLDLLALGDLGETAQRRFRGAVSGALTGVDVVKVAHHGSADQDAALYREIGAGVALIGVGAGNTYGHPTRSLLDVLGETGAAVTRTDLDGAAAVVVGESGMRLWRQRDTAPDASSTLVAAPVPHPVAGGGSWPHGRPGDRRRRPASSSTRSGGSRSGPPP